MFENKLIKVIDKIVPLTDYCGDVIKVKVPSAIKNKINKRNNRLLKLFKRSPNLELKTKITRLNCEIN